MRKVTKGNVTIKLWDIGGQPRFRSMWERYCRGVNAIVYMVDAAAPDKMESAKQELHALLAKEQLASIPVRNWGRCRCPLCPSLQRARSRCSAPAVNVNVGAEGDRGREREERTIPGHVPPSHWTGTHPENPTGHSRARCVLQVLVLGNKNDLPKAMEVETLIEMLGLKDIPEREVCCYSISCKSSINIDITLDWLKKHRKTGGGGGAK